MIGFNELGRKGNLGNQLFQFAGLRGIASNREFNWQMPPMDSTRIHDYALFRLFSMKSIRDENIGYSPFETYQSKLGDGDNSTSFHFDDNFFNNCPDNVNINGFFQSEKYFGHIAEELKADLEFKNSFINLESEKLKKFDKDFIAIHVRRGDYLRYPEHHPVLGVDYYYDCLSKLPDLPIVVFTNDKEWIYSSKFLSNRKFVVSDFLDYGHDLYLMSKARYLITANSSFSWWGAWLSNAEQIFAPKTWFGPKLSNLNTGDIYPDSWNLA